MINELFNNPISFLFWALALVIAVDIHEFSHAWAAEILGDPTPRLNGRLTLNPLAHLDPIGTIALLIFHIGWGKPVPIDPFNLKNPRRDAAFISLAGPAANLILAGLLSLSLNLPFIYQIPLLLPFIYSLIILCVGLGVFNLIPIPPLDGSKILFAFLPGETVDSWEDALSQYGIILLLLLIFPIFGGRSLLDIFILPLINLILNLLLPIGY